MPAVTANSVTSEAQMRLLFRIDLSGSRRKSHEHLRDTLVDMFDAVGNGFGSRTPPDDALGLRFGHVDHQRVGIKGFDHCDKWFGWRPVLIPTPPSSKTGVECV